MVFETKKMFLGIEQNEWSYIHSLLRTKVAMAGLTALIHQTWVLGTPNLQ